ncbi:lipopolysaccharide biosynthesis protein [Clostridium sp. AF19-22AC]|jgi:teichuronic acid exporter|uniref:lipopolysaccharide biosynthesis protein n=1 Tax=Clostridia TaxID=186801 RepID=UPI000E47948F|nr:MULTISPECIES: lipopolysaccharide biosynthesis protein [Clostridia]RHR28704.1 lipopolysaccharide biosynthesis protein [Clostridium sp. AF19-22AC]
MNDKELKTKVASGMIWAFGERFLSQIVSFVVSIVLARMLVPDAYGVVTLVTVFINIANVFVTNGLGEALIQKKDADDLDFSTMFYCSIVLALAIYLILFFSAPYIAMFYKNEHVKTVLRVIALKIPLSSISTIQNAYISKRMMFKKFFFSTFSGTLLSGTVGIIMAYAGLGVWALVAQYLLNTIVGIIVLLFIVPWHPKLLFSIESAKALGSYGWKLMSASLIQELYTQLRSLIIGRMYTTADLAYYNKGNNFATLVITNVDTSINKVVFPALANSSDNPSKMRAVGRRAMKTTSFVIFPIMAGLFAVADTLVYILLGENWMEAAVYLQIACVTFGTVPVQTANWQIIKAMGRSDICLKLEIVKKIIGVIFIILSMGFGVKAIAVSAAVVAIVSMLINMGPNKKLIGYSIKDQIIDLLPSLVNSVVMAIGVVQIARLALAPILTIVIQICVGVAIYILLSIVFKVDSLYYLLDILKKFVDTRKIRRK